MAYKGKIFRLDDNPHPVTGSDNYAARKAVWDERQKSKANKRPGMLKAQSERAKKISEGRAERLALFIPRLRAWADLAPTPAARRLRQNSTPAQVARTFYPRPELYRDPSRPAGPDNLPELSEDTIASYVAELRKRGK